MIRDATEADLQRLAEMGAKFHETTQWKDVAAFDQVSFEETCRMLMREDYGILLVSERGMIGGLVYPLWFNNDHHTAQELFWWCEDGKGKRLLVAFEKRAFEIGGSSVTMGSVEPLKSPEKVYERRGYKHSESLYLKGLN